MPGAASAPWDLSGHGINGNPFPGLVDEFKFNHTVNGRKKGIVPAPADIEARVYSGTALTHDYGSALYSLAAEPLDAQTF